VGAVLQIVRDDLVGLFDNSRTHFARGAADQRVATNTIAITQDGSRAITSNGTAANL
jgi:hypothetical protein